MVAMKRTLIGNQVIICPYHQQRREPEDGRSSSIACSSASSSSSSFVHKAAKALFFISSIATVSGFMGRSTASSLQDQRGLQRTTSHLSVSMSALANSHSTSTTSSPPSSSLGGAIHKPFSHTPEISPPSAREQPLINQYPIFPRAAVNIVVVRARPLNMGREYLFVQRSKEPGTNQWALPGGSVEVGEPMLEAAAREVVEETTLDHNVLQFYPRCFMTTDAIYNDDRGAVKYHFVISQMVCWASPDATPVAADDAKAIRWMTLPQLRSINVNNQVFRGVVEVIETVERLVDVGCITKADLVRVPVEGAPEGGTTMDRDDEGGPHHHINPTHSASNHLIPPRR